MEGKTISNELTSIFDYINNMIVKKQTQLIIDEFVFISAVLDNKFSFGYKILSKIIDKKKISQLHSTIKENFSQTTVTQGGVYDIFDDYFNECSIICEKFNISEINSCILLLSILSKKQNITDIFSDNEVTCATISDTLNKEYTSKDKSTNKPKQKKRKKSNSTQIIHIMDDYDYGVSNTIETSLMNISYQSNMDNIPHVVEYDDYYKKIFNILLKKDNNNVVICGKNGVGKTATAKHLANLINNKSCPTHLQTKMLVELDFSKFVVGTSLKGGFEQKYYSVLREAEENGEYIFFIDNLQNVLNSNVKYAETNTETLLQLLLSNKNIPVICTISDNGISSLHKSMLGKYFQEVIIDEPSIDKTTEILKSVKNGYENFHDVIYGDNVLKLCSELSQKYITNRCLPASAIDFVDILGANINLNVLPNNKIKTLEEDLREVEEKILTTKQTSSTKACDIIDGLYKQKIAIKSKLKIAEKEGSLNKQKIEITTNDVYSLMTEILDIPFNEIAQSDKTKLKHLQTNLDKNVIGQNEAVSELCSAVKRHRVGLSYNERPCVLMFLGSTGTGKTYLAKELAKELFGDEKYFVRMDMSEYSDKTSVSKLCGSNNGYVGYEDDTFLIKTLKTKKHFVLLLDEFEKSHEAVHNVFLQIFDDGIFTDNHGTTYNLKDVIIILTSNAGVSEASQRGKAIGFNTDDNGFTQSVIEKVMKQKFSPELLNRIQKTIFFNNLHKENLFEILKLEILKLKTKIAKIGYTLSEEFTNQFVIDMLYAKIESKKEFGARPIVNIIQHEIEDKIIDYIVDNDVEKGHIFTPHDLNLCNE